MESHHPRPPTDPPELIHQSTNYLGHIHRPSIRARTPDALKGPPSLAGQITWDTLAPAAGEAEKPRT